MLIDYDDKKDIYVSTSGELLIEVIEQLNKSDYPFETTITINDKNYYIFT